MARAAFIWKFILARDKSLGDEHIEIIIEKSTQSLEG